MGNWVMGWASARLWSVPTLLVQEEQVGVGRERRALGGVGEGSLKAGGLPAFLHLSG